MSPRNRQILRLAVPSIVSNITVPLLGLVDVAIVGHIGDAAYIGAIAVGSMVFNILYWLFGFLRMGTSGLTSQALGRRDAPGVVNSLLRSLCVALGIALLILAAQNPIRWLAFALVGPAPDTLLLATQYYHSCVWGAPATLVLYSLSGWFVGMQNTRLPMMVAIFQNLFNIAASLLFVFGLHWQVRGVAAGTVLAQYAGAALAVMLLYKYYGKWGKYGNWEKVLNWGEMSRFFRINSDIFIRTLCLVTVNFFFLSMGARQGNLILAVNTLLTQLYILYSYFMDGFAFAGEAMCGKYFGAHDKTSLSDTVRHVFGWGALVMMTFTIVYMVGGQAFLNLLTDDAEVTSAAMNYFGWALAVPLAGMAAFVWDGIFIGLTATKGMLISSLAATAVFFLLVFFLPQAWGNHALWMAFVVYLLIRGLVQTVLYPSIVK